jgi:cysteine synthase A
MKGYDVTIYLQDGTSQERFDIMKAFGANVTRISNVPEIQDALKTTNGDFVAATNILKQHIRDRQAAGEDIFFVDQMLNPKNPLAHHDTTGAEIWEQTEGDLAAVVSAVGTGGTIRGISDYVKSKNPAVKVVAVEPASSPVLSKGEAGPHKIQGIGAGFVPKVLDTSLLSEVIKVSADDAGATARAAGANEGLLVGISSGASLWAALELSKRPEFAGKTIVALLPDTGERYLSTWLFS